MPRGRLAALAALVLVVGQAGSALAATSRGDAPANAPVSAPIAEGLLGALDSKATDRFVVEFSASADLHGAYKVKNYAKRGQFVLDALTSTATKSQAGGVALARKSGAKVKQYWLLNVMVVQGDAKLARQFAKLKGVSGVRALKTYPLVKPVEARAAILAAASDPEWGVEKIRAPEAWADGILGQGVVVSSVDTGVDYTHPALVNQYRGNNGDGTFDHNYNWWDPTGICGDEPCDNAGHGTHTMGTMVGGDGPGPFTPDVGVAPGARWIAAKGCEDFDCSEQSLLSAGQWILAPTDLTGANPDPSKRPDIVNNSWGSGPGDPFYLATVQAWRAAGIIPVFSSGNPGSGCGDGGSPGDFTEVFSAGATDINDTIADFSGRGPSTYGKINPDITAPGVDVISSVPGGGYESFSGTSMAAPHTSGTIALVLSAKPSLIGDPGNFVTTTDAIRGTAVDRIDMTCGGADDGDPNNVYGDGRIDAKAAVDLVATGGTAAGTVTDDGTGDPIAGAQVTASGGSRDFTATTDTDGHYELFLAAGSYDLTTDAFGYATGIATGITIVKDTTTTTDFALVALPRFNVTGHVLATEDGSPLSGASVTALGTPVAPAITDGAGSYSLNLPIGTYSIRATAGGCTEAKVTDGVELVDQDITLDVALARKLDDFGHGCRAIDNDWVEAPIETSLFGDDFVGRLHLPFTFQFYGVGYDQVFVSDNGYLTFAGPDQFNSFPTPIPNTAAPNAAIYAFWRDLYIGDGGQLSYTTIGSPGDRTFVLELSGISVRGAASPVDFEIKLHESGETVDILYGNNPANPGDGRGATIGIENAAGTDALEFAFSGSVVTPNSAFRYEPVPNGIVHGTITDANDDEPIAGASVSAAPGLASTKTAADGTYSLRMYPGNYELSVSATGYVPQTTPVSVGDGDDLTRDASLLAPIPTIDPPTVNVAADFEAVAVDQVVTLGNDGSAPLTWDIKERSRGSSPPVVGPVLTGTGAFDQAVRPSVRVPVNGGGTALAKPRAYHWTAAHPSAATSVLVYADDPVHPAPDTYVDQALQRLGLSYTAHYEADFDGFVSDLQSGSWDLVIFADDNYGPDLSVFDALNAYVQNGGRLIFDTWVTEFAPDHPLFATLGFSFSESVAENPEPVYWWQPDHPAFTYPEEAPQPTEPDNVGFGIYGQRGDPLDGAEAIAGYTTPGPDAGQGALVIANNDRTAYKGFLDGQNSADLDSDGIPDGVELWENLAFGIGNGFFVDIPWLSESPTSGTTAAGDSDEVTLAIGDPGLAPGEYRATVVFRTNAPKPRTVSVNVTLTVGLPAAWGAIEGTVMDAHSGEPIAGVDATLHAQWDGSPLDVGATSDGDGAYSIIGPSGTWPLDFAKDGYVTLSTEETVDPGTTRTGVDAELHQQVPHGSIDTGDLTFVLTGSRTATRTVTVGNFEGHADLTFDLGEVNLEPDAALAGVTGTRTLTPVADPLARSTKGSGRHGLAVPPAIQEAGDVLAAWSPEGLDLPWGVGYTGNVWLSSPVAGGDLCSVSGVCTDTEFTTEGDPTGGSFETTFGDWAADMAFDPGRGLIWQVAVGGDNGIYGIDPSDGSVQQELTGAPWSNTSQRGLAYDPAADEFYVGGWNEGIVYRVAGPSHPTPGETLGQCSPADPNISGLAWNKTFGLLWEATNSDTDDMYLIDPATCATLRAVPHPSPGGNGGGIELDRAGNLWIVSQNDALAFLVESGLPEFSDVPWLSVTPTSGTVAPDASTHLKLTVNAKGVEPGVHRGIVVIRTNDPELGDVQLPVTLIVPVYQRGINAGGPAYTDRGTGVVYASDRAYRSGRFGYVGTSDTRSTRSPIAHTTRDPLYKDLRVGMSSYRFKVPDGVYQVDLSFAELQAKHPRDRVFSVTLEGEPVLFNFDVRATAGKRFKAVDRTFFVEVTDGVLDVKFFKARGLRPIVNAILVTEMPPGSLGF